MPSLYTLIHRMCTQHKDRVALRERRGYRTYTTTFDQLYTQAKQVSRLLADLSVKEGDCILLWGPSSPQYVATLFGAWLQGIITVPIDIQSDEKFVAQVQKQTKAKILFTDKNIKTKIKKVPLQTLSEQVEYLSTLSPLHIASDHLAQILYTSGTTGHPKGVMLSHGNFLSSIRALSKKMFLPKIKFMSTLPLSHILEQVVGLLYPLSKGCSIFYPNTLRPSKLTELIRTKDINALVSVPSILESLQQEKAWQKLGPQFFLMGVGGAKLDPTLEKYWWRRGKIVLQGYGATETTGIISSNTPHQHKVGTVGTPTGTHVKLVDGELWIKGKHITKGYYKNKEKTNEALDNGWYKTGDQASIKQGYISINGRAKEMIVTKGGENVFPEDIERVLHKVQGVKECCVVEHKGDITGVIIPSKKVKVDAIASQANEKLLAKQRIAQCIIWHDTSFPRTAVGKVRKFLVKEQLKTKKKPVVLTHKLLSVVAPLTSKTPKMSSKLGKDLLLDSLARVQLLVKIEEEFGVELPEQDITELTTLKQLDEMIKHHKPSFPFMLEKWLLTSFMVSIRRMLQQVALLPLLRYFWKVNCVGAENLKNLKKPVVFMANHQSHFDAFTLLKCLPAFYRSRLAIAASPEKLFGISKTKMPFTKKILGWNTKVFMNGFPFGNALGLERSLSIVGEVLDRNFSVLIFPEGLLTRDGKISKFQPGTGFVGTHMDVDIVPVWLDGLYDLHPVGNFWPKRGTVTVHIGKPTRLQAKDSLQAAKEIEQLVTSLAPVTPKSNDPKSSLYNKKK